MFSFCPVSWLLVFWGFLAYFFLNPTVLVCQVTCPSHRWFPLVCLSVLPSTCCQFVSSWPVVQSPCSCPHPTLYSSHIFEFFDTFSLHLFEFLLVFSCSFDPRMRITNLQLFYQSCVQSIGHTSFCSQMKHLLLVQSHCSQTSLPTELQRHESRPVPQNQFMMSGTVFSPQL